MISDAVKAARISAKAQARHDNIELAKDLAMNPVVMLLAGWFAVEEVKRRGLYFQGLTFKDEALLAAISTAAVARPLAEAGKAFGMDKLLSGVATGVTTGLKAGA